MNPYYLAVDIGASSGRHILGWREDGKIKIREIYRFSNEMSMKNGMLCWDIKRLFEEIKAGMKACAELGIEPATMGIDTWGVDFVLLDKQGQIIGDSVGYRDNRTVGMDQVVSGIISAEELYERTGIQKQMFNTIYQLMALKKQHPEQLDRAESLLMIPDYLNYLLTGVKKQEYTNATTTQLVHAHKKTWDTELIQKLKYPEHLFGELSMPGTVVGTFTDAVQAETGLRCQVVLPATHDTGSAVAAVPSNREEILYISSGTWSLLGTERMEADCRRECQNANFANEGGYESRFRFLKNIMGLWMIQSVRNEWKRNGEEYSFGEICQRASKETISSIVDCNDSRFLAPGHMGEEISSYCREHGLEVPQSKWQLAAVIYNSLAACYATCCRELEALTGKHYDCIHIVGGGANADYLNQLTAKATGRTVYAGPTEATAIGNLLVQMIQNKEFDSLARARECVFHSFEIKEEKGGTAHDSKRI